MIQSVPKPCWFVLKNRTGHKWARIRYGFVYGAELSVVGAERQERVSMAP